ncbi:hypothetical protein V6N12_042381 [Hibiscus sabdariffa]|uniref:RNase H type-1 domain-containing protein n=1 Tax=Hibiscus sabdariffa TaxID=183260 RepID=A0ABR2EEL9_9ROSI
MESRSGQHLLPTDALLCIVALKEPNPNFPHDRIGWALSSNNLFIVKSAYEHRARLTNGVKDHIWSLIHNYRAVGSQTPQDKLLSRARYDRLVIWDSSRHPPIGYLRRWGVLKIILMDLAKVLTREPVVEVSLWLRTWVLRNVIVESNCVEAIKLIHHDDRLGNSLAIVRYIKEFYKKD